MFDDLFLLCAFVALLGSAFLVAIAAAAPPRQTLMHNFLQPEVGRSPRRKGWRILLKRQ